jgi:hypothetical protein
MDQLQYHQNTNKFLNSSEVSPGVRRFHFSKKLTENCVSQLHLGEAIPPALESLQACRPLFSSSISTA